MAPSWSSRSRARTGSSARIRSRSSARRLSPAGSAAAACLRARELDRPGLDLQAQRARDPGGAHEPQRIVGEGAVRRGAQDASLGVRDAARGIDRLRVGIGERDGDRVHREVAEPEIGLDAVGAKPRYVEVPRVVAGLDPPGPELLRELERRRAGRLGDRPGVRLVAPRLDGQIDVDHVAAEQGVAHGAADDPAAVQDFERRGQTRGLAKRVPHPAHEPPSYSRSTRGSSPVVTS